MTLNDFEWSFNSDTEKCIADAPILCVAALPTVYMYLLNYLLTIVLNVIILDCSLTDDDVIVNTGHDISSGSALTVGDVLRCSVQDAVSYRWTSLNGDHDAVTYGQTRSITQPGIFNYSCTAYVECNAIDYSVECSQYTRYGKTEATLLCPLTRNISGFARGCTFIAFKN